MRWLILNSSSTGDHLLDYSPSGHSALYLISSFLDQLSPVRLVCDLVDLRASFVHSLRGQTSFYNDWVSVCTSHQEIWLPASLQVPHVHRTRILVVHHLPFVE